MLTGNAFREELVKRLEENADTVLLRIALSQDVSHPVELTGRQILTQARELARRTVTSDPGSVIILLLPHSVELFLLHFGLLLEGRLPAILAWPTSRIDPEKYQRNLLHQLRHLPAQQLITAPKLVENIGPGLPYLATECRFEGYEAHEKSFSIPISLEGEEKPPQAAAAESSADAVFLQFSGGTTGAQKCVVVTAAMMEAQMLRLRDVLAFGEDDGVASWLPMYHDMGLIACLWFPIWHGRPSLQFSAGDWLLNPGLLFEYMERYKATFCWLPNFAFSYMAAQRERIRGNYTLGHVRGFVNCSEPVRLKSFESFAQTFADWGVRREQMQASYGMAENVFALTQTSLGEVPQTIPRSQVRSGATRSEYNQLAFDLIDDVYVSSGPRLDGMEVRILHANGDPCEDLEPGEIQIRTECLFSGYWGNDGFKTNTLSADGWYSTGDYGFEKDGELYVIGRLKDIVIVGGQNLFPEDVEAVINTVDGIYPGRVVAFGVPDEQHGTEALAAVAEMRGEFDAAMATRLERQIQQLVLAAIGVAPRYVAVVPERWIVKSTAGKISRRDTRERFRQERLRKPTAAKG